MKARQTLGKLDPERVWSSVIVILLVLVGFAGMGVAKSMWNMQGDAVFVAVLFVPVLVYVMISGKLEQLKGPGGLEAKFVQAGASTVNAQGSMVKPSVDEIQVVAKEGMPRLIQERTGLDETKPIVLMLTFKAHDYRREEVLAYIENLSQFRNFKFVVFNDPDGHFAAYIPSWAIRGLLAMPALGVEFTNAINRGDLRSLRGFPGIIQETISTQSSYAEALREMTRQHLEALVVVDGERKLTGVVERDEVMSQMLLALIR